MSIPLGSVTVTTNQFVIFDSLSISGGAHNFIATINFKVLDQNNNLIKMLPIYVNKAAFDNWAGTIFQATAANVLYQQALTALGSNATIPANIGMDLAN